MCRCIGRLSSIKTPPVRVFSWCIYCTWGLIHRQVALTAQFLAGHHATYASIHLFGSRADPRCGMCDADVNDRHRRLFQCPALMPSDRTCPWESASTPRVPTARLVASWQAVSPLPCTLSGSRRRGFSHPRVRERFWLVLRQDYLVEPIVMDTWTHRFF